MQICEQQRTALDGDRDDPHVGLLERFASCRRGRSKARNQCAVVNDTVLTLRCKDQTTEAAFSTRYNYLGSRSVDVTLRINDEKPFKEVWKASIDGRAAFASDPVEFIRMLPDNAKLFIKTSRSDGKTKEASFNLGNVSDIRNKIANACEWDDTPNDPVGSVDRPGSRH